MKAEHPFDKETLALMDKRPGKTEPGAFPVETNISTVALFHWQEHNWQMEVEEWWWEHLKADSRAIVSE